MDSSLNRTENVNLQLISYVCFTFVGYFIIGLSLSVLPIFINKSLGFSLLIAGIVISLQYISTFFSERIQGKLSTEKVQNQRFYSACLDFL